MRWLVVGFDRETEIPAERIWLPPDVSDDAVLSTLGLKTLSEFPYDGCLVTERLADLIHSATGKEVHLAAREYWIDNTATSDWVNAESERQRESSADTRIERWVILGFSKITERLTEYVEIPPSVSDAQISEALRVDDSPSLKFRRWDATTRILELVQSATRRALDTAANDYYLEFQRDLPSQIEAGKRRANG